MAEATGHTARSANGALTRLTRAGILTPVHAPIRQRRGRPPTHHTSVELLSLIGPTTTSTSPTAP